MSPELRRLVTVQHGVVHLQQALARGETPSSVRTKVLRGDWVRLAREIYRVAGAPESTDAAAFAAWLLAGTPVALTGCTAAGSWGLDVARCGQVHVLVPASRRVESRDWLAVTRTRRFSAVRWRGGLPVVPLANCLLSLARELPAPAFETLVHDVLRERRTNRRALLNACDRGMAGSAVLRDAVALASDGHESRWERRLALLLVAAGLPRPVAQYAVRRGGRLVARVDLAYPRGRIVIEIDGYLAHVQPAAFQRDRDRQNALVALGFVVLRFTARDVATRPHEVVGTVAAALRAASA